MAISSLVPTSGKTDLGAGVFLDADAYKCALYVSAAALGASTTAYSASNEATGTGYSAGGAAVTKSTATSGTKGVIDFTDVTWTGLTSTFRYALIYDNTKAGKNALCVIDFGADVSVIADDYTIVFPVADSTTGMIRIG